jgi:hypothetical protein
MAVLPNAITPTQFNDGIPRLLIALESLGRVMVFTLPALFSVGFSTTTQKRGLIIYVVGVILYCASYGIQNFFPNSDWSTSTFGFSASAFTNIFWMVGLGLLGERIYFAARLRYKPIFYIGPAFAFVVAHTIHAFIYRQTHV